MTTPHNPITNRPYADPNTRIMFCDGCGTFVLMAKSRGGEWLCGQGHNMTAQQEIDDTNMLTVEAAALMFLGVDQDTRRRLFAVLVDLLGPVAQELGDAIGRSRI